MARLLEKYRKEIHPQLSQQLGIANTMAVPRLEKVVVSMGVGRAVRDKNPALLTAAMENLTKITGQKPQVRRSRKSISNFKLRENMDVGWRVTLRGRRMYEFIDRLFNAAIPRTRDFRGLPTNSFDGRGNYSMGLPDESIFAEIDPSVGGPTQGMNVTFVTTSKDDQGARELLTLLGLPFRRA